MSRKPKKGYFVRGQFVAEGSELDLELKAERKGTEGLSRTDRKKDSDDRQDLGVELLTLRTELIERLNTQGHMTEQLREALAEARRITNFEGKRRQMQYVGKLMRKLSEASIDAVKDALNEQRMGSTQDTLALHLAESWRDRLMADDAALQAWMDEHPSTDSQQLRALVRQARKDDVTTKADIAKGLLPRQSRAYREIFQLIKEQMNLAEDATHTPEENEDSYKP
ncbi:ribosome biogenesis factor YjgA [Limnohabitans sp.]|uniref:ribosome biogenesis factor YjgA n=1 Tax=Limnohabitans sp. TaxID=1907725 RepID=UPI00286F69EC|nr:ribosome biogenesis factor YjgA [Limnohabitans sp.]